MSTVSTPKKLGRPKDVSLLARRREQILRVAAQLFATHGYPNTEVQLVADTLGVGKGTIYRYFPSKRDLFLAAVDRGMRQLQQQVQADTTTVADPLERIACAIRTYLVFFEAHPEIVELFMQERAEFKDRKQPTYFEHREANIAPWRALARQLITAGRLRSLPPERLAVVGDLLYGIMFTNYFSGHRKSAIAQAEDFLDVVFHGILSDSERQRQDTGA
jgi:AcrR family transcriptional regulator